MLKFYHTLIPLLLVAGCELLDNDIKMGPDRYQTEKSGIRGGSSGDGAGGETGTIPKDTLLYVSGIAFPQGYNWQRDTAFGTSGGRLQLFRNGTLILDEEVSYTNCVSEDPDMHRIIDGHLVTDYSTDSETVIKIDGKEELRYRGREMIAGILIRDDGIWTLGESRDGNGLKLRKNGEEIYVSGGRVMPQINDILPSDRRLYEDDGAICFAVVGVNGSGKEFHYIVIDGVPQLLEIPPEFREVFDIRRHRGKTVILGGGSKPILGMDMDGEMIRCTSGYQARIFRLAVDTSGDLYAVGEIRKNSSAEFCPSIWIPGSSPQFLSMKTPALFLARDGEDFAYIEAKEGREIKSAIMNLYHVNIPFRSRLVSPRAAELANGRLTAALTPYELTERPAVLCRDSLMQYDINGYLTGVQTILKEK